MILNRELSMDYIAGFLDADGCIYLGERERKDGFAVYPNISFTQKYPEVLRNIYSFLDEKGSLYERNNKWVYELSINDSFEVNKKLKDYTVLKHEKSKKLSQYNKDQRFNREEIDHIKSEFRKPIDNYNFENINDEWLAGFLDGDGCITCSKATNNSLRFRLQVSINNEHRKLGEKLSDLYGGFVREIKNDVSENIQWNLELNEDSLKKLSNTLEKMIVKGNQALIAKYWMLRKIKERDKALDISEREKDFVKKVISDLKHNDNPSINLEVYQILSSLTAVYPVNEWISYLTLGLVGEAGEVAEKVKKSIRDDRDIKDEIQGELSDVFWYLSNIIREINNNWIEDEHISMKTIAGDNINKLFDRKDRDKIKGSGDNR